MSMVMSLKSGAGCKQARRSPAVDALIAATARVHDLTLVTRNTRDFARLDVRLLNPFSAG